MTAFFPEKELLAIWRAYLTSCALITAFIFSVVFRVMSVAWLIAAAAWFCCFVFFYAAYLPLLLKRKRYRVERERITAFGGYAYRYSNTIPVRNIQYVSLVAGPFERMLGICSVVIVAAGGRMVIQGLSKADGENLMFVISDGI